MPFVGERLTRGGYVLTMAADPFGTLQGAWSQAAMLRRVMVGETVHVQPPGAGEALPVRPGEALRGQAADLLAQLRRLGHEKGEQPTTEVVFLRFLVTLFNATGATWEPDGLTGAWNDAMRVFGAPAGMEPFAAEEDVQAAPHLAPARAQRLAAEGEERDALEWLAWWKNQPGPKTWEEGVSAAETMVRLAHASLDRIAPYRETVRAMSNADLSLFSPASQEQLRTLGLGLGDLLEKSLEMGEQLLAHVAHLLDDPPDARGAMLHVTRVLPLVIRMDNLAVDLADGQGDRQRRSAGLARELKRGLERLPSHGEAWATLAAWQELQGLQPLAEKQAKHFGAWPTYLSLHEMFERDGLLLAQK